MGGRHCYLTSSVGLVGLGPGSRGTGDVASIRAGFRMIGRDMGGTPTCRGEASGCKMSGGWAGDGGEVSGTVMEGTVGGTGEWHSGDPGQKERQETRDGSVEVRKIIEWTEVEPPLSPPFFFTCPVAGLRLLW